MYAISSPSAGGIGPVHSFGTAPESGPHRFGTGGAASMGPPSFTGGGIPSGSQRGDMGNALTHKQSARIVVAKTDALGKDYSYAKHVDTLVEKEFTMVMCQDGARGLSPLSTPGDHAPLVSLAYLNYMELSEPSDGGPAVGKPLEEYLAEKVHKPFGPMINRDDVVKNHYGVQQSVANVTVGGRATFSNCFIRTSLLTKTPRASVVNGDAVYAATFVMLDNNTRARTFNFLFVDNDYSMLPDEDLNNGDDDVVDSTTMSDVDTIPQFMNKCLQNRDMARGLCRQLIRLFQRPGTSQPLVASNIACMCTAVTCIGVIVECPVPNEAYEHPVTVLQGMISDKAVMSQTHPVVVQMSS